MPKRITATTLNASTVDILNVIRQNAPFEYQSLVPEISDAVDIPKVGEILLGNPALSNQFINALVSRIAKVIVDSKTFNNPFAELKKGYLEFGETVEEIYINTIKALRFSAEEANFRELKRTLPDVRTAFHAMNWSVVYPITIQDDDLRTAFLSESGVQELIARIVSTIYTSAAYDEYLLMKYLLIKAVNSGSVTIMPGGESAQDSAVVFRSVSNQMTFMNTGFNMSGVLTLTDRSDQYIFMSADYNAQFDVEVLASAFNMGKADFIGKLILVDSFTTFDNERFEIIRSQGDMIEVVTQAELDFMANIKAIIVDKEFFQVYDNLNKFTEKYVASGLYWNYFYHVRKTVSYSPFSNIVAIGSPVLEPANSYTFEIDSLSMDDFHTVFTLSLPTSTSYSTHYSFVQNPDTTTKGIAVQKYGAFIVPNSVTSFTASVDVGELIYSASITMSEIETNTTITFNRV